MDIKASAERALGLAAAHVAKGKMPDSAQLCLNDASLLLTRGQYLASIRRSLHSLAYSVTCFHEDTQEIERMYDEAERAEHEAKRQA